MATALLGDLNNLIGLEIAGDGGSDDSLDLVDWLLEQPSVPLVAVKPGAGTIIVDEILKLDNPRLTRELVEYFHEDGQDKADS